MSQIVPVRIRLSPAGETPIERPFRVPDAEGPRGWGPAVTAGAVVTTAVMTFLQGLAGRRILDVEIELGPAEDVEVVRIHEVLAGSSI